MTSVKYIENSVGKFGELNHIISVGFNVTKSVAEDIDETESGKEIIKEIKDIMIGYAEMERDVKQCIQAAENTKQLFLKEISKDSDVDFDLLENFESNLKKLAENNNPDDVTKHHEVQGFLETVWTQHYRDETQQTNNTETNNENNDDDDDIVIDDTQQDNEQRFICPITKVLFVDPVKSNTCQHTFSRKAIEMLMKSRKEKAKCPIPGCNKKITAEDLVDDHVMAYGLRKRMKK